MRRDRLSFLCGRGKFREGNDECCFHQHSSIMVQKKALVLEANFMQQNLVDICYLGPMCGNVKLAYDSWEVNKHHGIMATALHVGRMWVKPRCIL